MYEFPVEYGKIREFAVATRSANPAYFGPDAIIPPTFLTVAGLSWEPPEDQPSIDLDLSRTLHGEEEYEFHGDTPRAGQTLTVRTRVADQFEKRGERGGVLRFAVVVREFHDTSGRLVATQRSTALEPAQAPTDGEGVMTTRLPALAAEDTGPSRTFGPITRTDIVRYAGAAGDFNPLHHDDEFATDAGFAGVFSIGMLHAGLLATHLTDWLGEQGLRRFKARFREQVWPGDVLTCSGRVRAVEQEPDENLRIEVELSGLRQTGTLAVTGVATLVRPAGAGGDAEGDPR